MKIIFLALNVNINARTGDAVHVRELAMNLAKLEHHVALIAGYSPEQSEELQLLEKHPNIQISYNKNRFKIPFPRSRDFSSLWTCLKVARKNPPDVIYERSFSPKIGVVLSKILRKPLVVEINGIVEEEAKLQGIHVNHRFTKNIRMKIRQRFFNSANKIVAVTLGIKEDLYKRYNIPLDKIVVIPNGANTDIFRPMDQTTVKRERGLNQKSKYVCFVGNLAPWQGVEYIIEAAPIVLEKVSEAKFLIVGDGMMRNELEGMVKKLDLQDVFIFTGSVSFEEVPKYINASDVCVAPFIRARNEKIGLSPLKIYEYVACGKPVVGSDIKGVGDFLEDLNVGISFLSENYVELAHAIIKLLLDSELIDTMGENGRKVVVEKYSWGNTAERVIDVCEELVKVKHGGMMW
ncbi:MAG: glycosyltransferase family 4 protein [Methanophagales archaeon]|nr:glycosyltransferase family 4 protein [Methanophagales archaeon]